MLNINNYACTGRLTQDAEAKADGNIVELQVAVSNAYQDKSGEWKNETAFITAKVFGKSAERAGSLLKGQPVYIEGRIKQENWEKDGQKRSKLVLNALSVKPFDVPQKGASGASEGTSAPAPATNPNVQQYSATVNDDVPF